MNIAKDDFKKFKQQLKAEQKEIEEELNLIAKKGSKKNDYKAKFEDYGSSEEEQASETSDYTDRIALENQLELRLLKTRNALARLKNKTFGMCENCKAEIELERLQADPLVNLCLKCTK